MVKKIIQNRNFDSIITFKYPFIIKKDRHLLYFHVASSIATNY